jgi:hypothetical protein
MVFDWAYRRRMFRLTRKQMREVSAAIDRFHKLEEAARKTTDLEEHRRLGPRPARSSDNSKSYWPAPTTAPELVSALRVRSRELSAGTCRPVVGEE